MAAGNDTYEYWVHKRSGGIYAVRLNEGRVTGTCGPLALDSVTGQENPSGLEFREAAWIEERREEYCLASEWLRGRY